MRPVSGSQQPETKQNVRKRRVFYIPGYDPVLPRRYRELYRSEGALQADISGYQLDLKGRKGQGAGNGVLNYQWVVNSDINGAKTHSEFEFLLWSDIVQKSMNRSIPASYLLMLRLIWIYVSSGALFPLLRLRKGPVIAAFYPIVMLLLQLLLGLGLGGVIAWGLSPALTVWGGVTVGLIAMVWLMRWFRALDGKIFVYYLLHDYAFSARFYGAEPPELRARMVEFSQQIHQALLEDNDEVLLVGHSSGAHLGVGVLAEMLRQFEMPENAPRLSFLTLGQVVPMVSFLPKADRLRQDLHELSQSSDLTWVDVTAPGDGCTFALCDPVSVSGVAPKPGKKWPLVLSAAFRQTLSPALYDSIKRRFFRLHFQYLCAFDQPGDYDYFQITAGPLSLAARFEGRVASPSRIETPISPYQTRGGGA